MVRLVDEAYDLLRGSASLNLLGPLLSETWRLKCQLCPEVNTPQIEEVYQRAMACGATGGKLLGAGGGGFMLFHVPEKAVGEFRQHVGAETVQFKISEAGSTVIIDE